MKKNYYLVVFLLALGMGMSIFQNSISLRKINKLKSDLKNNQEKIVNLESSMEKLKRENTIQDKNNLGDNKLNSNTNKKYAYLTFDDGPSDNTEKILSILRNYNIKATFFVTGTDKTELYKRINEEGHSIGNHTYSHDCEYLYSNVENFKNDVDKLSNIIKETTETAPVLFRFPGGSKSKYLKEYGNDNTIKALIAILEEKGYEYFDWNVSSEDATGVTVDKSIIVKNVLKGANAQKENAVILFHDTNSKSTTVEALPEIIEGLKEQGFTFEKLTKDSFAPHFAK